MQIETYEIEEIKGELGVMAADSEAIELINSLGLSGQQKLCDHKTEMRFPYAKLTALQEIVYGTVFPEKTAVEDYSGGILPLRVLQIVAHVRQFDFIKHVRVWHPKESRADDPVLVATEIHPTHNAYSDGPRYLLARWGHNALLPFEALADKAKAIWIAKRTADLTKARNAVSGDIENLADIADEVFLTGDSKTFAYYA